MYILLIYSFLLLLLLFFFFFFNISFHCFISFHSISGDMFNYNKDFNVESFTSNDKTHFVFRTTRNIAQDEELTVDYGNVDQKPNFMLLNDYHYVYLFNPNDYMVIPFYHFTKNDTTKIGEIKHPLLEQIFATWQLTEITLLFPPNSNSNSNSKSDLNGGGGHDDQTLMQMQTQGRKEVSNGILQLWMLSILQLCQFDLWDSQNEWLMKFAYLQQDMFTDTFHIIQFVKTTVLSHRNRSFLKKSIKRVQHFLATCIRDRYKLSIVQDLTALDLTSQSRFKTDHDIIMQAVSTVRATEQMILITAYNQAVFLFDHVLQRS
ncbi:hypothetical protein RFI_31781 [Reticulomyxa filosa]|uniref:SET domain-containing protein n=1 Tax=Reticulomyxa filosa TaxID=46433 RepID=X6LW61_RETFI|nr:hypothetical protein RFI_31781 [Reticulomyxa filosa]|eukprot:ETO05616.1 hypothetical protein RFI_31781 [Reticulomyxa filosa]